MNNTNKSPLVELGAAWKRKSQKGESFLTAKINLKSQGFKDEDVNLIIFSNKNKTSPNQPDLKIFLGTPPPVKGNNSTAASVKQAKPVAASSAPVETDEELI